MLRWLFWGVFGLSIVLYCSASTAMLWQDIAKQQNESLTLSTNVLLPDKYRTLGLDEAAMRTLLSQSAPENVYLLQSLTNNSIDLPLPDGTMVSVTVLESPIMESALAAKFPEIKTYIFHSDGFTGRLDITPLGFHGLLQSSHGSVYIDPRTENGQRYYISYYKQDYNPIKKRTAEHFCQTQEYGLKNNVAPLSSVAFPQAVFSGEQLRSYRIAMAVTGEYTQFHGGTVLAGLSAVATTLNRINSLYERDMAVRLILVADNDLIIYTDANTDPYTNSNSSAMLSQNQNNLTAVIGANNYDIGHVMGTSTGGVALLGVVCDDRYKAYGATGSPSPSGDPFDIDYVSHEIGHEFGATHTFNGSTGNCNSNRNSATAFEPGSGSSIMAYAGICGAENLQAHSDAMFHSASIDQVVAYTTTGVGSNCATVNLTNNNPPTVNAGMDFTIPANTPFELSGSAADSNLDTLTYSWEQLDLGSASTAGNTGDNGNRPIFRSFNPSLNANRIIPRLAALNNNLNTIGEWLPNTQRLLHFRLTVRDQKGGVNADTIVLTVDNASGPFSILSPNGGETVVLSTMVQWNVAGTESGAVSCRNVDILLSSDSGDTFNDMLLADTPNDGNQVVSVPQTNSAAARIKVKCSDNIFFDISNADFNFRGVNAPPVAVMDYYEILEDSTGTGLNVLLNDIDPDINDTQKIVTVQLPDNGGVVSIDNNSINNNLNYSPAQNFVGTETFAYTMQDSFGDLSSATVMINVLNVNDPPSARNDNFTLDQNSKNNILAVLENDTDIDNGDSKSITSVDPPNQGGGVSISNGIANQTLIYTPTTNFSGVETFNYTMQDSDGLSSTATVTITLLKINNPPNTGNDSATVDQDSTNNILDVLSNDADPDSGDTKTIVSVTNPDKGGTVSISDSGPNNKLSYTPARNFSGTENFSYLMQDASGLTAAASVVITVESVILNNNPGDERHNNKGGRGTFDWQLILLFFALCLLRQKSLWSAFMAKEY